MLANRALSTLETENDVSQSSLDGFLIWIARWNALMLYFMEIVISFEIILKNLKCFQKIWTQKYFWEWQFWNPKFNKMLEIFHSQFKDKMFEICRISDFRFSIRKNIFEFRFSDFFLNFFKIFSNIHRVSPEIRQFLSQTYSKHD